MLRLSGFVRDADDDEDEEDGDENDERRGADQKEAMEGNSFFFFIF